MGIIPTKIHGVFDYMTGLLLMAAPWTFDFAADGIGTLLPVIVGMITIGYSLFTNYELGISGKIPMKLHLVIDLLSGIVLAVSPWLFGFSEYVKLPHVVLGLTGIAVVLLSKGEPEHTPANAVRSAYQ